jgi:hypothetical protein
MISQPKEKKEFVCNRTFRKGTYKFTDVCTECGHTCVVHDYPKEEMKNVSPPQEAEWEKEFDKKFVRDDGLMDKYGFDEHGEQDMLAPIIKSFIRQLLQEQKKKFKEALGEELTKLLNDSTCSLGTTDYDMFAEKVIEWMKEITTSSTVHPS